MAILPDLSKASRDQLAAMITDLQAKNAALARAERKITCKVSEKGALSIYGCGRFPVTLYLSQFEKLANAWPDILDFVHDNRAKFSVKD